MVACHSIADAVFSLGDRPLACVHGREERLRLKQLNVSLFSTSF